MPRKHSAWNIAHHACGKGMPRKWRLHAQDAPIHLNLSTLGQICNIWGEATFGEDLQESKVVNYIPCVTPQRHKDTYITGQPLIAPFSMHDEKHRSRLEIHEALYEELGQVNGQDEVFQCRTFDDLSTRNDERTQLLGTDIKLLQIKIHMACLIRQRKDVHADHDLPIEATS